jgi:hypothetical protein
MCCADPLVSEPELFESALLSDPYNWLPSGCGGSGEGWAEGPSRRDAQRPSGGALEPERLSQLEAVLAGTREA